MAFTDKHMNDEIASHLRALIRNHGPGLGEDPKRLGSFLADLCPELKREISVVVAAAECRVPADIAGTNASTPWEALSGRLRQRLIEDRAITNEAAEWAIDIWANALGRQPDSARIPIPVPVATPTSGRPTGARPDRASHASKTPPRTIASGARNAEKDTVRRPQAKTAPRQSKGGARGHGKQLAYGLAAGIVCVLAGVWFLWPSSGTADPELIKDWDDSGRVIMTTGSTLPFFRQLGPKRVQSWKRSAEAKNALGMYMYARCLHEGIGVSKDESEALKWYRRAAELGNPRAMNGVGVCYLEGTAVPEDLGEALKWYRKAAALGETTAMTNLGHCYKAGTGVAKDETEAVTWFRKAAGLGDLRAMHSLGICYQNGTGIAKDEKEAVRWFRDAANLGNPEAMNSLNENKDGKNGKPSEEKK